MKKKKVNKTRRYPIFLPITPTTIDFNSSVDVRDYSIPEYIYFQMQKVAKIEGCQIRDLSYERKIEFYENEWRDLSEIIYKK